MVTLDQDIFIYDSTEKKPAVTVKDGDKTLTEGKDCTVTYEDNTKAGEAKITVTGIGNYTGAKKVTFSITDESGITTAVIVGPGAPEMESDNIQDVAESLFTDVEKAQIEKGEKARVWLEISLLAELPFGEKSILEAKAAELGVTVGTCFDISLYKEIGSAPAIKMHETPKGKALHFSVQVPDSMQNADNRITRAVLGSGSHCCALVQPGSPEQVGQSVDAAGEGKRINVKKLAAPAFFGIRQRLSVVLFRELDKDDVVVDPLNGAVRRIDRHAREVLIGD